MIAPDLAEKFDGKALEAEEARALRRTTFTMWEDDEGTCHGRFRLPARHGQMLTKMILAISAPTGPGQVVGLDGLEELGQRDAVADRGGQVGVDAALPTRVCTRLSDTGACGAGG